ncbi:helix-turn-helix domain-containing protein [Pararhizobium antarcticum]|uniref:HTH araC/xylS-type domain-containing protein n=1 Tax=Pararhizobium antarcticum TaxID=1798805 RepID=A0A657LXB7_9HYPH|nr:AraC family transcriptional regulator [Pararhizobium antarcticum]OJF95691.1 hypothetical protein AX761_17270 [Rhizobium sp. 58]OJF99439.1 hypothetical protein AX760_13220 [Pararhizobium antarcticum]
MDKQPELELRTNGSEHVVLASSPYRWQGLTLNHGSVQDETGYEFSWKGDTHYLAIHDLVLRDGEISVDGEKAVPGGDLRDRLTYLPKASSAVGWALPRKRDNSFTTLFFEPDILSDELERGFIPMSSRPLVYFESAALRSTMDKLRRIIASGRETDSTYTETLCLLAAMEMSHALAGEKSIDIPSSGTLSLRHRNLLTDFIEENLGAQISLSHLAELTGLSRFHFSRAFKKSFGTPPHRYIALRRITVAKSMLASSDASVSTVGNAVGFSAAAHFIRVFKEIEGRTPGEFRRNAE